MKKIYTRTSYLFATACLSLTSDRSNQICGEALARALWSIPKNPPCRCPICNFRNFYLYKGKKIQFTLL